MSIVRIHPQISLLRDMLYCSVGQDPNVNVGQLHGCGCGIYEIKIAVIGQSRAEALRVIIPEEYLYGEEKVCVKLFCQGQEIIWPCVPQKNERDVANLFCRALSSNDFFVGVALGPEKILPIINELGVFVCQEKIYFYEPFQYEEPVAKVFSQVIRLRYGLLITTRVCFRTYDSCYKNKICFYCRPE